MKLPKIIAVDLDGTFIPKHNSITNRGKLDLKLLQNAGVKFGFASGRPIYQIKDQVDSWNINYDFVIGYNGAELLDTKSGKEYKFFEMTKEEVKMSFDFMEGIKYNPGIYYKGENVSGIRDEMVEASEKYLNRKTIIWDDWRKFYEEPRIKVMFRMDKENMKKCEERLKKGTPKGIAGFKTGPSLVEFTNELCNKGFALKKYCELEGIDLKDAMAFGDTSNDNEMLKIAGVGICLKNGSDDTKAVADMITDKVCDEDGWADFIEKQLLLPNGLICKEEIIEEEIENNPFHELIKKH